MINSQMLVKLIIFLQELSENHDGDCRVYPAVANGVFKGCDWDDCNCHSVKARQLLLELQEGR